MALLPLTLVVLAAIIHATWNLLAKRAAHAGVAFVFAYNLFAFVTYAPWVIWVIARDGIAWSASIVAVLLLSACIHLAYSLCLQRGYQVADLSVVYPVARGTGPMLATVGAILLLGEDASAGGLAGLGLVIVGILLIATQGRFEAFRSREAHRGVRWGMGTGALIAAYTVVDGYAVKMLGVVPVVLIGPRMRCVSSCCCLWCCVIGKAPWPQCAGIGGSLPGSASCLRYLTYWC